MAASASAPSLALVLEQNLLQELVNDLEEMQRLRQKCFQAVHQLSCFKLPLEPPRLITLYRALIYMAPFIEDASNDVKVQLLLLFGAQIKREPATE